MNRLKSVGALIGIWFFAAMILSLPVLAEFSYGGSEPEESMRVIESFDGTAQNFRSGKNVRSVHTGNFTFTENGADVNYTCLEAAASYCSVSEIRTVRAEFTESLNLGDYRSIEYKIYVPLYESDPDASYYSRLTVYSSDGSSTETLAEVEGGTWSAVKADISDWAERNDIVSLEIAYVVDTVKIRYVNDNFYIDDVAAGDAVDRSVSSRFLFDEFQLDGASGAMTADNSMILISANSFDRFSLSADVFVPELAYDAGALRIKLANSSMSDMLTLRYTTSDTKANSEAKSVSVPIVPMSDAAYYYAYVGDVSMLRSIELQFNKGGGNVEIYSLSAVPYTVNEEYETFGNVTVCRLSDDRLSVSFYGEVDREVVLANQNGRIAIYAYDKDMLPTAEELLSLTPVASGAMTTRFEFSWKLPPDNPHVGYSRFIAVLLNSDGDYMLIAPPFCIDNPRQGLSGENTFPTDSKGFACDDISLVGEADSGITVISVDTRRVFDTTSEIGVYTYNDRSYYMNSKYVNELSEKITALNRSGVGVILRYIRLDGTQKDELVQSYASDSHVGYTSSFAAADGEDFIGALSAYTAEKWCSNGEVIGIIFGNGENVIPEGELSVSDMIAETAKELCKVYFNVISASPMSKIYISVTDLMDMDPSTNASELPINDYLSALRAKTAEYGIDDWEISVEVTERDRDFPYDVVRVNDCSALADFLRSGGFGDKHFIFCDAVYSDGSARLSTLTERCVTGYYSSVFNDNLDAYIAIAGSKASIAESVKCIDTTESSVITSIALLTLKADRLEDIIDGYDKSKLSERRLNYADALHGEPDGIKGTYKYFVFDSAANLADVEPGYYCSDMHIVHDGISALAIHLDSSLYGEQLRGGWMGISHRFEYTESLEPISVIAVDMKLENPVPGSVFSVPIKLVLHSADERFEADGKIGVGEWTTVYFDITGFDGIEATESFHLLTGGGMIESATLLIKDIRGLSDEYADEALSQVIAENRVKKRSPNKETAPDTYLWMGGAIIVGIATVATTALLSRRKSEERG